MLIEEITRANPINRVRKAERWRNSSGKISTNQPVRGDRPGRMREKRFTNPLPKVTPATIQTRTRRFFIMENNPISHWPEFKTLLNNLFTN
jgi:hypothetical protein